MPDIPLCPQCDSSFAYIDREQFVCPECGYEWVEKSDDNIHRMRCSNGNVLNSGDTVTVIRDLKVKGASSVIKVGTKVKNIRVLAPEYIEDNHDIDCKIEGFGAIKLKSSVVKKT